MKINKVKLKLINIIYLLLIILIIYLVYILIISLYNNSLSNNSLPLYNKNDRYEDKFVDRFVDTPSSLPTTESSPVKPITQKGCNAVDNVVDFCINYDNCCAGGSYASKACFCNHPITLQCKAEYDTCMSDTSLSNLYTAEQLKQKCSSQQKNCCVPYNSISLSSDKFDAPIKNEPSIKELCSLSSVPNLDQKCLELCQTTPDCKAYSVNVGKILQTYGMCKLYNTVEISKPKIDPISGKPSNNIATDYYIKK